MLRNLESEIERIKSRLKRIEDILELSPVVISFDWKEFTERDKEILNFLVGVGRKGASTTEIARAIKMEKPETSGRTIVWRRLQQIMKVSNRLKGSPIVIYEKKRWSMNFDEFNFPVKED